MHNNRTFGLDTCGRRFNRKGGMLMTACDSSKLTVAETPFMELNAFSTLLRQPLQDMPDIL